MESVQPPRSDDNDFTLYLETEAARYELGSVIRGGMTLQKAPREIADEVIAHLKYGFEK